MSLFTTRLPYYMLLTITCLHLAQLAVPAQAQTQITTCGFRITVGGGEYILANDLVSCPADGIDISAGHVTLDLNGNQIMGSGTATGIKVERPGGLLSREVKIHGPGTIINFDKGIELVDAQQSEVSRVTSTGNITGFMIDLQHDSWDNQIHDNVATANRMNGFVINDEWSHYDRNQSNQNSGSGFLLAAPHGKENFLNGNTADQNANDGIEAQSGAVMNLIEGNHATGNVVLDLADNNPQGCKNTWYRNSFGTRNKDCIK